jgi:hypothetical protein
MKIDISLKDFTLEDLNIIYNLDDKEIYYNNSNDIAKNNFEVLYLLELINEDSDYNYYYNESLINEFMFNESENTIIDLLDEGILSESIISLLENKSNDINELLLINKDYINDLDDEDYLEYCYPYIINNGININLGREKCLNVKKDIKTFSELNDILYNEE